MSSMFYSFLPANATDVDFFYALFKTTMYNYIQPIYGWEDDILIKEFHEDFMKNDYFLIVLQDNFKIGGISYREDEVEIHLRSIQVLPEFQKMGIGTQVLLDLMRSAKQGKKLIRLEVLKNNPAQKLYERLGFSIEKEDGFYYYMLA